MVDWERLNGMFGYTWGRHYLGVILEDENEVQECFRIIQSEVLEATIKSLAYVPAESQSPADTVKKSWQNLTVYIKSCQR